MKMRKAILCPALALALSVSVFAAEPPADTTAEAVNGPQQTVKVFTVSPDADPKTLIEEPFVLDGFRYTYADMTKEDNTTSETAPHTETVSVESDTNDLTAILELLDATMEYDDGEFSGTLTLDHNSIETKASGYASGSKTVTATKTIGPLDRNDMSYIPATTVKNGKTLTLSNVEWQVMGTDLVGETLVPSAYQAVATYSGKANYSYATGYTSTAEYVGDVTRSELESVTYRLTYLGEEYVPEESATEKSMVASVLTSKWTYIIAGIVLLLIVGLVAALIRAKRELSDLREEILPPEDDEKGDTIV